MDSSRDAAFEPAPQRPARSGAAALLRTTGTMWSGLIMRWSSRSVRMSGRESCGLEENATATSASPSSSAWMPASATVSGAKTEVGSIP